MSCQCQKTRVAFRDGRTIKKLKMEHIFNVLIVLLVVMSMTESVVRIIIFAILY